MAPVHFTILDWMMMLLQTPPTVAIDLGPFRLRRIASLCILVCSETRDGYTEIFSSVLALQTNEGGWRSDAPAFGHVLSVLPLTTIPPASSNHGERPWITSWPQHHCKQAEQFFVDDHQRHVLGSTRSVLDNTGTCTNTLARLSTAYVHSPRWLTIVTSSAG